MKKRLRFLVSLSFKEFFFLFLALLRVVFGFTSGNLRSPELNEQGIWIPDTWPVSLRGSVEYVHIWNEKLSFSKKYRDDGLLLHKCPGHTWLGAITLDIKERIDLSFWGGALALHPDVEYKNVSHKVLGKNGFLWKAQGKAVLFEVQNTAVGVEAQYGRGSSSHEKKKILLHEWEIGLGLSQKIYYFIPYAGVSFRNASLHFSHPSFAPYSHVCMKQTHKKGLFVGGSLCPCRFFFFNVEGRFLSEASLAVSCDIRW